MNALRPRYDHVFTSGGIGPTHDDITADAVAAAFGVPIGVREDARAILATNYANPEVDLNPARLRMARIPDGAALIDNPVSKAPGVPLGNVHVMAGVPAVFQAMVAGLLPRLTGGRPLLSESLRIDRPEGEIAGPLRLVAEAHPAVSIGSYPFNLAGRFGSNLVARSEDPDALAAARGSIRALADLLTSPCVPLIAPRTPAAGHAIGSGAIPRMPDAWTAPDLVNTMIFVGAALVISASSRA